MQGFKKLNFVTQYCPYFKRQKSTIAQGRQQSKLTGEAYKFLVKTQALNCLT